MKKILLFILVGVIGVVLLAAIDMAHWNVGIKNAFFRVGFGGCLGIDNLLIVC